MRAARTEARVCRRLKGSPRAVIYLDEKDETVGQSDLELAPIHHYRLFRFLRKHTVWDAWLAGGEGAKLMRDVRKEVRTVLRGIEVFRPGGAPRRRIKPNLAKQT